MQRRAITLIVPCLVAGVVAGCGSTADEQAAAKKTVETYLAAFAAGDGAAACEQLTDTSRAYVAGMAGTVGATDCPTAFASVRRIGGGKVRKIVQQTEVRTVDVDGSKARVTLRGNGDDAIANLEKVAGRWKISSLPKA